MAKRRLVDKPDDCADALNEIPPPQSGEYWKYRTLCWYSVMVSVL